MFALFTLVCAAPISLELGSSAQLELSMIAQLRATEQDRPSGASQMQVNLQRLRETIRLWTLDRSLGFGLSVNTTPAALELIEASVELRPLPWLKGRAGLYKVPFTAYRAGSYAELSFVDWATTVTRPFGAEQQVGLEGTFTWGEWSATIGLFGGAPARAAQGLGLAPTFHLSTRNLADLTNLGLPGPLHPEIFARVSGRFAALGLELVGSAAYDLAPELQRDLAFRAAPELKWRAGPVEALGLFYVGGERGRETQLKGGLLEVHLDVDPGLRASARWAGLARDPSLVAASGAPRFEEERAVALAFRILGTQLELLGDLAQLREQRVAGVFEEWRARAQLQGGW